jgi:hypothetical protein
MDDNKPPEGLEDDGRWFWNRCSEEREFTEAHDKARLLLAAQLQDEISRDRKAIVADGRFLVDRRGRRYPNPALRTLERNRILFLRTVRELGLDVVQIEDRQPRLY